MICIVGGGVAGLLTATMLKHKEALIFEALPMIASRDHCAGIVSTETCQRLRAKHLMDSEYNSAIIDVGLLKIEIRSEKPFAVHIDRLALEKELAERIEEMGHRIELKSLVINAQITNRQVAVKISRKGCISEVTCEKLVVAEGFSRRLSSMLGLEAVRDAFVGAQMLVELGHRIDESCLRVKFDERLFPRGFAWLAPLSYGREALVGIVCQPPISNPITMLKSVARLLGLEIRLVKKVFGGHVFAGYPLRIIGRKGFVVGIGDCVSMVKSLSGGGLYAISVAAPIVARFVEGASIYEIERLTNLIKELRIGYLMHQELHRWLKFFGFSTNRKFTISLDISRLSYDKYLETLVTMMKTFGTDRMRIRWSTEEMSSEALHS